MCEILPLLNNLIITKLFISNYKIMEKKRCSDGTRPFLYLNFRKMKITLGLVLLTFMSSLASDLYSQTKGLSIEHRNEKIVKILLDIENKSEYRFFYNEGVDVNSLVSVEAKDASINDILSEIFEDTSVSYEIVGRQIILKSENKINSIQQKSVKGKVTDSSGQPLPGVTILVKGTTNGTITDFDGNYTISDVPAEGILVFSFVGMATMEVSVAGKDNINIVLKDEAIGIEEVVAVGYGKNSRKNLSSAITSVKSDDLNRGAIADVGQLLQGKVPGLNISASGDPTQGATIIMRGASTINSSQSPFYVIDGVPGADISLVAPDDIVSVDVLKDAAATSIYGNRAANGVIMVTTRRGKQGLEQISYNGYVGIETVSNQLDMMNASQLRSFLQKNNLSLDPIDDMGADINWQKEIQRSAAISQSHNISYSGGTERSNYIASISYIDNQGILLSSGQKRLVARMAIEQKAFNDKVKFGLNLTNSNVKNTFVPQRNVALLQSAKYLPVTKPKNEDGTYFENFNHPNYFNPLAVIEQADDDSKVNTMLGNFTAEVSLPFGFTYNMSASYQKRSTLRGSYYNSYYGQYYNSAQFYNNPEPPAMHSILNFGENGLATRSAYENTNIILENYLTWNKEIEKHTINAVIGYSWQDNTYGDGFSANNTNFPADNVSYNNLAFGDYRAVNGFVVDFGNPQAYQQTRLISDFARLNYNFDSKYMLQASIRRDGSSVFGENKKWGYFPSVGMAWRIDQEGFMKSQSVFSDLKLRASYGVTGNSTGFDAYTAQFLIGPRGTYYYNGQEITNYGPNKAANPNLEWEKTSTTNIGLDFSVLKGKLSGYVEVYDKKTTGMIYTYSVNPVLVPTGNIVANGGEMSNKGIEVSLNATPVKTSNFSWSSSLNLAHNKNVIEKLTNDMFQGGDSTLITRPEGSGQSGSMLQILKEGKPIGQFFTLEYAGKNSEGVSQYVKRDGTLSTNPTIGADYHYLGSPQPKLLLGWTNDFKYKNFDLNVFIRGAFGNKIFNVTRADLFRPTTATTANILVDAGNESANDLNSYKYSSRFIENGSYIRLDNATLGYNFKGLGQSVKNLRIYTSVNNLFVITKYKGIDPEVEQGGIAPGIDSNNFYPKTRTVLFGVKATF